MPDEILRMKVLNCFEDLSKLALNYCNSLIGLWLGANKKYVANEVIQISAFMVSQTCISELVIKRCTQKTCILQGAFDN